MCLRLDVDPGGFPDLLVPADQCIWHERAHRPGVIPATAGGIRQAVQSGNRTHDRPGGKASLLKPVGSTQSGTAPHRAMARR